MQGCQVQIAGRGGLGKFNRRRECGKGCVGVGGAVADVIVPAAGECGIQQDTLEQ